MKQKILILAILTLLISPAWAHGDENHAGHQEPVTAAPIDDPIQTLEKGYALLQQAVLEKAFGKIHEISEGIAPALKALGETHKDDASVVGAVSQLSRALDALHTAGDAGNAEAADVQLRKLDSVLKFLKARITSPGTETQTNSDPDKE